MTLKFTLAEKELSRMRYAKNFLRKWTSE